MEAGRFGMSDTAKLPPEYTRPFTSTATFAYVPATTPVVVRVGAGYDPARSPLAPPVGEVPETQLNIPEPSVVSS